MLRNNRLAFAPVASISTQTLIRSDPGARGWVICPRFPCDPLDSRHATIQFFFLKSIHHFLCSPGLTSQAHTTSIQSATSRRAPFFPLRDLRACRMANVSLAGREPKPEPRRARRGKHAGDDTTAPTARPRHPPIGIDRRRARPSRQRVCMRARHTHAHGRTRSMEGETRPPTDRSITRRDTTRNEIDFFPFEKKKNTNEHDERRAMRPPHQPRRIWVNGRGSGRMTRVRCEEQVLGDPRAPRCLPT